MYGKILWAPRVKYIIDEAGKICGGLSHMKDRTHADEILACSKERTHIIEAWTGAACGRYFLLSDAVLLLMRLRRFCDRAPVWTLASGWIGVGYGARTSASRICCVRPSWL